MLTGNVIAGNEVGLALQSTAALTVTGNRIAENLTDVRALGRQLSAGHAMVARRDAATRGASYRGYDADRDGIGDVPHQLDDAMDALCGATRRSRRCSTRRRTWRSKPRPACFRCSASRRCWSTTTR